MTSVTQNSNAYHIRTGENIIKGCKDDQGADTCLLNQLCENDQDDTKTVPIPHIIYLLKNTDWKVMLTRKMLCSCDRCHAHEMLTR